MGASVPAQQRISAASDSVLTPEDAQYFNHLRSLNIPAAEIAVMIEALREEREIENSRAESSSGAARESETGPPLAALMEEREIENSRAESGSGAALEGEKGPPPPYDIVAETSY